MKFGVREICNVTLRAKVPIKLGKKQYYKDEPVFYFDSLKTSTLEGASTTVYATGGRGNARLVAWEGDRTLTFTMEDALATPETLSLLTGSVLEEGEELIHKRLDLHKNIICYATSDTATTSNYGILFLSPEELNYKIPHISNDDLTNLYVFIEGEEEPFIINQNNLFKMAWVKKEDEEAISDNSQPLTGLIYQKDDPSVVLYSLELTWENNLVKTIKISRGLNKTQLKNISLDYFIGKDFKNLRKLIDNIYYIGEEVLANIPIDKKTYDNEHNIALATLSYIDYYYKTNCKTIAIGPEIYNNNYYLEAETLFREAATGLDYPANFIVPNCRLQSNFTFNMANSGDPGTFTFTIDAFPGYIKGGSGANKVLAAIQIIDKPDTDINLDEQRKATPYTNISSSTLQP